MMKKTVSQKVEPIRSLDDVKTIKKMLYDSPRNYALFVVGINTPLRTTELLSITCAQVLKVAAGDAIEIGDGKTVTLNAACVEAIQRLLGSRPYVPEDPLFFSQRSKSLEVSSLHRLVKSWCRAIALKGNYGSGSLRITWGYHQRISFGSRLPDIVAAFGHHSQRRTLEYLCIQPDEIKDLHENIL